MAGGQAMGGGMEQGRFDNNGVRPARIQIVPEVTVSLPIDNVAAGLQEAEENGDAERAAKSLIVVIGKTDQLLQRANE